MSEMGNLSRRAKRELNKRELKNRYFDKLLAFLEEYNKMLFVSVDNIGSNHMQRIRKSLAGKAVILMGKNTLIRKVIRNNVERNPKWENLIPLVEGNVGFVFTHGDLGEVRDICVASKVPAAAKTGIKAPKDVIIPKGPTGLEPTKTSFLQALNIGSKIIRGSIDIIQDVHLIHAGERVGSSEATLLQMLGIRPFEYGLEVRGVYDDGFVYPPSVLDLTDRDVVNKMGVGIGNIAAISLSTGYPTLAAFPHVVLNSYKNLLSIAIGTDYCFPQAEVVKQMVENPDAFKTEEPEDKEEEVQEEEEEEDDESEDMEFDLFG